MSAPLSADGARPLVSLVAALPREYQLTPGERLVLMLLACDSFDGSTAAPGTANLASWSGMWTSSVEEILAKLLKPTEHRPALLERAESTRGRRRTVYRLQVEPTGEAGELEPERPAQHPGQPPGEPPGQLPGQPPGPAGALPFPSPSPLPNTTSEPPRQGAGERMATAGQQRYLNALRYEFERLGESGLEGIELASLSLAEADLAIKESKGELYRLGGQPQSRLGDAFPELAAQLATAPASGSLSPHKKTTTHQERATA